MTRRQIVASLNKIANELDNNGLHIEANSITSVMKKLAQFDADMGGDDPNIAREFNATENANRFMTNEYTIILKNYEHDQEMMRIPASKVVKGYMFDLKELIKSLKKAGFGPGSVWGADMYGHESFDDGYYPEVDKENKTITLSVDTVTERRHRLNNSFERYPSEKGGLADQFHSDSLQIDERKKREQREQEKMKAFYPEI
jgi:hypothetical protein